MYYRARTLHRLPPRRLSRLLSIPSSLCCVASPVSALSDSTLVFALPTVVTTAVRSVRSTHPLNLPDIGIRLRRYLAWYNS